MKFQKLTPKKCSSIKITYSLVIYARTHLKHKRKEKQLNIRWFFFFVCILYRNVKGVHAHVSFTCTHTLYIPIYSYIHFVCVDYKIDTRERERATCATHYYTIRTRRLPTNITNFFKKSSRFLFFLSLKKKHRKWSALAEIHWYWLVGVPIASSGLQVRAAGPRVSPGGVGRHYHSRQREGRPAGRLYGNRAASRICRAQVPNILTSRVLLLLLYKLL